MLKFRSLNKYDIECRIQQVKENGFSILLYKNARCDMNILDETVGALNWQRSHSRENHNCTVSIWNKETSQWIGKEDTGTESNTEREKGLASDSFKRACFNWGIGRELYTAPFIWISDKSYIKSGRVYEKFSVDKITVKDGQIDHIEVVDSKGKQVFKKHIAEKLVNREQAQELIAIAKEKKIDPAKCKQILKKHGFAQTTMVSLSKFEEVKADFVAFKES